MSSSSTSARHGVRRSQLALCKCKSHCTTYNPSTGVYEGEGHTIPRTTRHNHLKDDRTLVLGRHRDPSNSELPNSSTSKSSTSQYQREGPSFENRRLHLQDVVAEEHSELQLIAAELAWYGELPLTSPSTALVFINKPSGDYHWPASAMPVDTLQYNSGFFALVESHHANTIFLSTERRLCEIHTNLADKFEDGATDELSDQACDVFDLLHEQVSRMCKEKESHWDRQRSRVEIMANNPTDAIFFNTGLESHFYQRGPRNPVARAVAMVSLTLEYIFFSPRRAIRAYLSGQRDILHISQVRDQITRRLPRDPRSAPSAFNLNPVTREYISCPSCHCLYPYNPLDNPENGDSDSGVISHCIHRRTPESLECNSSLWKQVRFRGQVKYVPHRKYLHHDLKSWIGRMLSRKGMEDIISRLPQQTGSHENGAVKDIWTSEALLKLKDQSGAPFLPPPPGEGRLVFGLSVDSFNPFYNKTAKQSVSSTGIWLILLNLPEDLRYLHENVCVLGIIPGPDKPSQDDINHYLSLVVDDILEFWDTGVFFSRTYNYLCGILYKGMLVPVICDMLAARQVIGVASAPTSHHFCTFCDLDIDDISILERSEWPAKDLDHIRHYAQLWKVASNEKQRSSLFEASGLRYSPLLRLPYWNPVLYTIVDSMHTLDLNLFQNHCRTLFQIDLKHLGGDASRITPILRDPSTKQITSEDRKDLRNSLSKCQEVVRLNPPGLLEDLLVFHRKVLYTICVEQDIKGDGHTLVVGTRWVLANNIYHWRQQEDNPSVAALVDQNPVDNDTDMDIDDARTTSDAQVDIDAITRRTVYNLVEIKMDREKIYRAANAFTFGYLCDMLMIDRTSISLRSKAAKRALFTLLTDVLDGPEGADTAKQLRTEILSNSDQENDEESRNDNGAETLTNYEDVPDEDRVAIRRVVRRLLSSTRDDDIIYGQGKATIFAFLCNILEIDYTHIDLARKSAKRFLYDSILGFVTMNPVQTTARLESFLTWLNSESIADSDIDVTEGEMATTDLEGLNATQDSELHTLPEKDGVDLQATKRVIRRLTRINFEVSNPADLNRIFVQGSSAIFAYVCTLLHLETDGRVTKRALFDHLIASVQADSNLLKTLVPYLPENSSENTRAVLGKDVMDMVWSDMKRTQLPTWVGSVPSNWGTPKRGKLTANHWRVVCTIHLPITLIRLWDGDTGRRQDLLKHFMDLVTAVRIANMRISTASQVEAYNTHMLRYVSGLQTLYPDQSILPSHHGALHIGDMLQLFGPVHSHSAPFFERYINFFHHMNTNLKFGELESTFMRASARNANLRALLADDDETRKSVAEMIMTMQAIEDEDIRGIRKAKKLDPTLLDLDLIQSRADRITLDPSQFQLIKAHLMEIHPDRILHLGSDALSLKEVSKDGVCYGICESSTHRNSAIIFASSTTDNHFPNYEGTVQKPGIVEKIIHYSIPDGVPTDGIYLYIQELFPTDVQGYIPDDSDTLELDPYRQHGFAAGYLCDANHRIPRVISLSQVISHFALTTFEGINKYENFIHILPLNKLMFQFDLGGNDTAMDVDVDVDDD